MKPGGFRVHLSREIVMLADGGSWPDWVDTEAVFTAVLAAAVAPILTANADVAPLNRASCPSVAQINKFRPANSSGPPLSCVSQEAPFICLYSVKGIPNVLTGHCG